MTNRKLLKSLVLIAVAALATGAIASRNGIPPKIQAKLAPSLLKALEANEISIPILVKMKKQADLSEFDDVRIPRKERISKVYDALRTVAMESQADLVDLLRTRGTTFQRFYIYNAIAVWSVNEVLLKEIAARDDVEKVYRNPTVRLSRPVDFSALLDEALASNGPVGDNISFMKADQVWKKYGKAGDGIVVAGQDTGVEWQHPALIRQYRGKTRSGVDHSYSWHDSIHKNTAPSGANDCGFDLDSPCDDGDHGSHTMGTMVGSDGSEHIIGMAPNAKWIACRNMDGGNGTPATYLECFEWLLAPYAYGKNPMVDGNPAMAPHVINNSWGCPPEEGCTGDEILPALQAMKAAGIMVVVSAGNDGPGCGTIQSPPAIHSALSFSVGAYNHRGSGSIATFSSRGPSSFDGEIGPDVVAPGVSINSSIRAGRYSSIFWSGTSMAGPHVAGAVALLWSIHPEMIGDIDGTAKLLRETAIAKTTSESCGNVSGSSVPNNTFGHGVLDVLKAIEVAGGGSSSDDSSPEDGTSSWPSLRR